MLMEQIVKGDWETLCGRRTRRGPIFQRRLRRSGSQSAMVGDKGPPETRLDLEGDPDVKRWNLLGGIIRYKPVSHLVGLRQLIRSSSPDPRTKSSPA
jgi:hypothetical protein